MPADHMDQRARKTRSALLNAFFVLVQECRYDEIKVADIATRAGVSRSAFYAHFAGKDALLATSVARPFSMLAATLERDDAAGLIELLDHFWANRALAHRIFQEPIRRRIVVVLTDQIERILDRGGPWKRGPLIMPSRLAAIQLAEMLLAPLVAWLAGISRCDSRTLATALRRVGSAALEAMSLPAPTARR